jgi:hypothetical protein
LGERRTPDALDHFSCSGNLAFVVQVTLLVQAGSPQCKRPIGWSWSNGGNKILGDDTFRPSQNETTNRMKLIVVAVPVRA